MKCESLSAIIAIASVMWGEWNYMHWIMILRIKPSWRALFWHTAEHPHSSVEDKGWTQPLKPRIQQRLLRIRSQREILSQIAVRLLWDSHSQCILTGKSYVETVLLALFFPHQASLSLQRKKKQLAWDKCPSRQDIVTVVFIVVGWTTNQLY